jgi:hypothetical protein
MLREVDEASEDAVDLGAIILGSRGEYCPILMLLLLLPCCAAVKLQDFAAAFGKLMELGVPFPAAA